MATVSLMKSVQVCCSEEGLSSTAGFVWERDVSHHEQSEALDFRRALQEHA